MIVTLIGYRGSGKTSVARLLAARWGYAWIDADAELERRQGRTIRDIFDSDGEPHFRELERALLAELLAGDRLVVAAGGGAVLDAGTRRLMRDAGPVVWLRASVDTLASRIAGDPTTSVRRPNLTDVGGGAEIERLLSDREPIYRECASVIVETDGLSVAEVVDRIAEALPSETTGGP